MERSSASRASLAAKTASQRIKRNKRTHSEWKSLLALLPKSLSPSDVPNTIAAFLRKADQMFALFQKPLSDLSEVKAGDIIGFSGEALVSLGINIVTYGIPFWSISHIGIMGEHDGRLLVFESTTTNTVPCEVTQQFISGSQAHSLDHHIKTYCGKMWHYPLSRSLYHHERKRLNTFLHRTIGLSYDNIGAYRAGGLGFSWLESRLRESDLHSLFCSEWCAAAHTEIGLFATDNASRWSPNLFCRTERRMGLLRKPRRIK